MSEKSTEKPAPTLQLAWLLPLLLTVGAFILYFITLSPAAFPGSSAAALSNHLWIDPFPPMTDPVWGWMVDLFAKLPIASSVSARVNLFNALCGALSTGLLFLILTRMPASMGTLPVDRKRHVVTPVRAIVGFVGALTFALAVPTWVAATRADPVLWGVLVALLSVYCLLRYSTNRLVRWAVAGCFLVALGATGYGAMIAIAPFYAVALLVFIFRNGQMRVRTFLLCGAAFIVGLIPLQLHATIVAGTPAFEWREFKSVNQLLFYMARDLYHSLLAGIPKYGWVMIGLVTLAPWLMVVLFRLGQNRKVAPTSRWGGYILNTVLTCIGFALPFRIAITPWQTTGLESPMVMPYVLIAMWYGVLAGFWYVELVHEAKVAWRKTAAWIVVALFALCPIVGAVTNWRIADGRSSQLVHAYLDEVLDSVGHREWLVTGGVLESDLALRALEKQKNVKTLSQALGYQTTYLRYVSTFFQGHARLQALAQVGLTPLLNEWLASDPAVQTNVAILGFPDLWFTSGGRPLPDRVLFVSDQPGTSPEQIFARSKATWTKLMADRNRWPDQNPAVPYHNWILSQSSKVANNLGVYLEDAGRADLARESYLQSRQLNTNNLSALLNLFSLARRDKRPEAGTYEKELRETLQGVSSRSIIWSLSRYYGYVRSPELYAGRGFAWALSGKPNLALNEMKRAMEMTGGGSGSQLALANLFLTQNQADEGERVYRDILMKSPTNIPALFGIARATIRQGKFDEALGYLARLRDLKAAPSVVLREQAVVAALSGDRARASKLLAEGLTKYPDDKNLLILSAAVASDSGDTRVLQNALAKIGEDRNLPASTLIALGQIHLKQNDRVVARRRFEQALQVSPGNVVALEALIRLDISERKREEAERHIQMLLTVDSRNALANYTLGTIQVFNAQYALAEASYRTSLGSHRTVEVLNDLAWVLMQNGNLREALGYATEAIQMPDAGGNAWDTLGVIQMRLKDLEKAEQSLQKAMALQPENPSIALDMAELYEAKGMLKEAEQLSNQLLARAAQLDRELQDKLTALSRRLREKRGAI